MSACVDQELLLGGLRIENEPFDALLEIPVRIDELHADAVALTGFVRNHVNDLAQHRHFRARVG